MTDLVKQYLLVCRECGDGEDALPIPFSSAAERGGWAAEHTRGTGHDKWWVHDITPMRMPPHGLINGTSTQESADA